MRRTALLITGLLLACANESYAYETHTHALMTREAYSQSGLSTRGFGSLVWRLGIDRLDQERPFQAYWDPALPELYFTDGGESGELDSVDEPNEFERCQMQTLLYLGDNRLSFRAKFTDTVEGKVEQSSIVPIQNWLVRGAIREDDLGGGIDGLVPTLQSDCGWAWMLTSFNQPGDIVRPLNHFYDPVHETGLDTLILGFHHVQGLRSTDWALGYQNSFSIPQIPASGSNRNHYSYLDARNAFWNALTYASAWGGGSTNINRRLIDSRTRMVYWATLFRSLGNVVHLLQDSSQPQHTRNDPHSMLNSDQQVALEDYTNSRVLGSNSVGSFVRGFFVTDDLGLSAPPLGQYGLKRQDNIERRVQFATPLRFFTTKEGLYGQSFVPLLARAGLADYSNKGFFTGGTFPGMQTDRTFQYPPQDFYAPESGYSQSYSSCEYLFELDARLRNVTCLHFLHPVSDNIDPEYAESIDILPHGFSLPNAPIAAEGVFRRIIQDHGDTYFDSLHGYSWSPTVLETIGNLTIPRAIGYSAGLLDFFFRGTIELSSPPEGLYAVVDQGTPHHVEGGLPMDEEGRVFGFKKLRVRVRNTTMIDAEGNPTLRDRGTGTLVPQTMHAGVDSSGNPTGRLVAIARYHRNPCYLPDLSGEYVTMPDPVTGEPNPADRRVPSGCSLDETRSAFQEVSVSAPLVLDTTGNLSGNPAGEFNACVNVGNINSGTHGFGEKCDGESVLAEFDFSDDPVPINATDLFLQVAYRGPLGLEEDGIAVGTRDLVEPNYLSGWNGTDWFYQSGHFVSPSNAIPDSPGQPVGPEDMVMLTVCVGEQTIATLNSGQRIPARGFFRLAMIRDTPQSAQDNLLVLDEYYYRQHENFYVGSYLPRQFAKEDINYPFNVPAFYRPQPIPWHVRGTTMGMIINTGFYRAGFEDVDRTMQALVLSPAIGTAQSGIATQVRAGLDAADDLCHRIPPPEYPPEN